MKTFAAVLVAIGSLALLGCESKPSAPAPAPTAAPAAATPTGTAQTKPASTSEAGGGW